MTWRELSEGNAHAAKSLLRDETTYRAAVARAYYAVYQLVTHSLIEAKYKDFGEIDGRPRLNPTHEKVATLASKNLSALSTDQRREIRAAVSRLRNRRLDADYRPGITIDIRVARESVRDMFYAVGILEKAKGGGR